MNVRGELVAKKIDEQTEFELTGVEDVKTREKLKFTETSFLSNNTSKDRNKQYFLKYDLNKNYIFQLRFDFNKGGVKYGMIPTLDAELIYIDEKQKPIILKEFKTLPCHHTEQKLDEETDSYIYPFKVTSENFKKLGIIADDLELNLKITRCLKFKSSGGMVSGGTSVYSISRATL